MDEVLLPALNIYEEYISYALYENDVQISSSSVILSVPKFFHYKDPRLSCTVDGGVKRVKILSGRPENLKLRSVFDIR